LSIEETIILSVISGVITSVFIFLCIAIFNKIIIPWYRQTIYRGLDINGTWETTNHHENVIDEIQLDINQHEQNISGAMSVIKIDSETNEIEVKTLDLTGTFQDGHLMLIGNNKDKKLRSHITYLANIVEGGYALHGMQTWVDSGNGNICGKEVLLTRKSA
jgi:lipopolysaccharide export LptBFGC system permease protein LptF